MDRDPTSSTSGDPTSGANPANPPGSGDARTSVKPASRRRGPVDVAELLGTPAAAPAAAKPALDGEHIPEQWRPFHRMLLEIRQRIGDRVQSHSKETLTQSTRESSGDLSSYSLHLADAGTDSWDRDFGINLLSSEHDLIFEVDEALERIQRGTYGICELTGEPIPQERLRAIPWARYGMAAQARLEEQRRRAARLAAQRGSPVDPAEEGEPGGAA